MASCQLLDNREVLVPPDACAGARELAHGTTSANLCSHHWASSSLQSGNTSAHIYTETR